MQDEIISQFRKVHLDKYGYDLVDFKGNNIKVKIICKIHNIFEQTPADHKRGNGCPICNHKVITTSLTNDIKHIDRNKGNFSELSICKNTNNFKPISNDIIENILYQN